MPRMLLGRTLPERTLAAKDARPPYCGSRAILRSRPRLSAAREASGGVFGDDEMEEKPVGDRGPEPGNREVEFSSGDRCLGRAWLEAASRGRRGLPRGLTVLRGLPRPPTPLAPCSKQGTEGVRSRLGAEHPLDPLNGAVGWSMSLLGCGDLLACGRRRLHPQGWAVPSKCMFNFRFSILPYAFQRCRILMVFHAESGLQKGLRKSMSEGGQEAAKGRTVRWDRS